MKLEQKELFIDDLKDTDWLGEVVNNEDPNFDGRVKIRVFGKFDNIPVEDIPWARSRNRFTSGATSGSGFHSVPKVGSIVNVKFDNGNLYEPEYESHDHIADELKSILEESYENAQSLWFDVDEELALFYTQADGIQMAVEDSILNIRKDDKSIIISKNEELSLIQIQENDDILINRDGDSILIEDGTITQTAENLINESTNIRLGSQGAPHPAVHGDNNSDILNQLLDELKRLNNALVRFTSTQSSAIAAAAILAPLAPGYSSLLPTLNQVAAAIPKIESLVPKNNSDIVKLD